MTRLAAFLQVTAVIATGIASLWSARLTTIVVAGPPRPAGLILSADGTSAWIAHQRPATIQMVNLDNYHVETWHSPFHSIHDLTAWGDHSMLALVDEPMTLVRLDRQQTPPKLIGRWSGIAGAHCVRASGDGQTIAVASLEQRWIRLVRADALSASDAPDWMQIDLPFSPGEVLWLTDDRHLVVADAFGGRLGIIDAVHGQLRSVREVPGHNLSGLTLSPDKLRVFFAHQSIHGGAQTSLDDVHWGGILTNVLRSIRVSDIIDPAADLLAHTIVFHLGDIGHAAGDPAGVAVRADGLLAVTLGGVSEVVHSLESELNWRRVEVGTRPRSILLTPDGERAVVLNDLDDSLSIVPLVKSEASPQTIHLSEPTELSAVERGERLFFNARLSHDGWFSCHSCHTNGHTNGQLVDNQTDGSFGTPKRVLSLRGIRDTAPYGWDGHLKTLADQVQHSVTSTMQGDKLADDQLADLVAYLETVPPWPVKDRTEENVLRGATIFQRENCVRCHSPAGYTSPETYDVGLSDQRGLRRFNPPSLRGVRHGGPYFHHGRAETLEQVLTKFRHQLQEALSPEEEQALTAFLRSL